MSTQNIWKLYINIFPFSSLQMKAREEQINQLNTRLLLFNQEATNIDNSILSSSLYELSVYLNNPTKYPEDLSYYLENISLFIERNETLSSCCFFIKI